MITGFELGRGYQVADYDAVCVHAALHLDGRWATWDGQPFRPEGSYVVSVHCR